MGMNLKKTASLIVRREFTSDALMARSKICMANAAIEMIVSNNVEDPERFREALAYANVIMLKTWTTYVMINVDQGHRRYLIQLMENFKSMTQ